MSTQNYTCSLCDRYVRPVRVPSAEHNEYHWVCPLCRNEFTKLDGNLKTLDEGENVSSYIPSPLEEAEKKIEELESKLEYVTEELSETDHMLNDAARGLKVLVDGDIGYEAKQIRQRMEAAESIVAEVAVHMHAGMQRPMDEIDYSPSLSEVQEHLEEFNRCSDKFEEAKGVCLEILTAKKIQCAGHVCIPSSIWQQCYSKLKSLGMAA